MTKERALYLIAAHRCRVLERIPSMLVIVNERINFQFSIALFELPNVDEDDFVATITVGHVARGRKALRGIYRDYHIGRDYLWY